MTCSRQVYLFICIESLRFNIAPTYSPKLWVILGEIMKLYILILVFPCLLSVDAIDGHYLDCTVPIYFSNLFP